jgi:hypothetical protein
VEGEGGWGAVWASNQRCAVVVVVAVESAVAAGGDKNGWFGVWVADWGRGVEGVGRGYEGSDGWQRQWAGEGGRVVGEVRGRHHQSRRRRSRCRGQACRLVERV